jgi:hypothetical protein
LLALVLFPLLIGAAEPEQRQDAPHPPNNIVGLNLARLHQPRYIWAAADLVNANGGAWGYVTILLTREDRDSPFAEFQLQQLLDRCFESKLQPIVRVATQFDVTTGVWERPTLDDPLRWRLLFDRVRWPSRTVWIVPANEPNLGREWGGTVDAADHGRYLERFLDAFGDSERFKVLNAPLNLSNETSLPDMQDAFEFLAELREHAPSLLERLPAWASNLYQVDGVGPGVRYTHLGYLAELDAIGRDMPVIITETGVLRRRNENEEARFFSEAYRDWRNDPRIVAATPLLWDPDVDDHWLFSFDATGAVVSSSVSYQRLRELPRVAGSPDVLPPLPKPPVSRPWPRPAPRRHFSLIRFLPLA